MMRVIVIGSTGVIGSAVAEALVARGHEVILVSGPVNMSAPDKARIVPVRSAAEMLSACLKEFSTDGAVTLSRKERTICSNFSR